MSTFLFSEEKKLQNCRTRKIIPVKLLNNQFDLLATNTLSTYSQKISEWYGLSEAIEYL